MPTAATKNSVITRFDPSRLNSAVASGFRRSVLVAAADANANKPASLVGARGTVRGATGFLIGTGALAHIFEGGAKPHVIAPGAVASARSSSRRVDGVRTRVTTVRKRRGGKQAMAGQLDHPISVAIPHPGMRPRPYLGPAGARWAQGGCAATMRASLILGGFR